MNPPPLWAVLAVCAFALAVLVLYLLDRAERLHRQINDDELDPPPPEGTDQP